MTVTYSVCISCAGIDYSRVTSVSYAYSAFSITLRFLNQLVRATLARLLGYACPVVKIRVSGLAVTDSVRFCGGSFDSFLGFEYVVLITLASHVFEYFLRFLLQACVVCAFWLRCLPSRFPHVRSLSWVFRLLWCCSELQLRWRRLPRRLQRRFFC